ncbi:MAG: hypothetical protein AABX08_01480 [Nanoarchaeota archaeon]
MHTCIYSNWREAEKAPKLLEHLNGLDDLLVEEGFEKLSLTSKIGVRGRVSGYKNNDEAVSITHFDFTETKITEDCTNVECWCNAFHAIGNNTDELVAILSKIRDYYDRLGYEISCFSSPYEEDRQARKDEISNTR